MKKKSKKAAAPTLVEGPKIEVIEVTTLRQLEAACREPIVAMVQKDGKVWQIKGQSLTPGQREQVDLLLQRALPPLKIQAGSAAGTAAAYDLHDPGHLANVMKHKGQARALALYLAYPIVREDAAVKAIVSPALDVEKLTGLMRELFTEEVQNEMFRACIGGSGAELWDRVSFI